MSLTSVNLGTRPRVFALLIGINKYKDKLIHDLNGTIADCEHLKRFLEDRVDAHITRLYDEVATRENILKAITALAFDSSIKKDDPILIYYAGHGAAVFTPSSWNLPHTSKIQMILPHDFIVHPTQDSREGQGIFDRSLSDLLSVLSNHKGDNIVVIFDCCHSGSGTRESKEDPTSLVRGVELPEDYAADTSLHEQEQNFVRNNGNSRGYTSIPTTHVLLAACREDQTAKENNGRGSFTSALLRVLGANSFDKITYKELILRLSDIRDQNPQCEGTNENRTIFGIKRVRRTSYPLQAMQNSPDLYLLQAGDAHGITAGAEFSVHPDYDTTSHPLGTLVVQKISSLTSVLQRKPMDKPFEIPHSACAVEIRKGNHKSVRVTIVVEDGLKEKLLKYHGNELGGVMLVGEKGEADLKLVQHNDAVGFEILEKQCVDLGMTRTHYRPGSSLAIITRILQHAAHFYLHLRRSNKETKVSLASKVTCELIPVRRRRNVDGLIEYTPEKDQTEVGNIHPGGLISNVSVGNGFLYGIKITNNHPRLAIFLWVFYFNQSDFSIDLIHKPAAALDESTLPCLSPGESLTIGYGRPGESPFIFSFRRIGQQVDVGFLKLFLSTSYLDHSGVEQSSMMNDDTRYARPVSKVNLREFWDTLTVTIVQRPKY